MKKHRRTLAIRSAGRKPCGWPASHPELILLTDALRLPDPLPAMRRLPPGSAVILRHYEWSYARRLALGHAMNALCRQRGLLLLVAGDARLARAVGADGVHLPQGLLPQAAGLRRRFRMMTAAAHDAGAVARAARAGIDAVLVSPVFATASHPGVTGLGVLRFAALARQAQCGGLGVYALGGMDAASMRRLRGLPMTGIAGIGGLAA
ncbi:thiamine phosphate synthase [Ferrovibrio sp.]|jgi:thiamine-phosphate pyrophosphorylase|uniref:thiamine phosphate synthase n=1 Tax=Ferrovibrio sp. TaxID=1917215 RepID=UPI0035AE9FFC